MIFLLALVGVKGLSNPAPVPSLSLVITTLGAGALKVTPSSVAQNSGSQSIHSQWLVIHEGTKELC